MANTESRQNHSLFLIPGRKTMKDVNRATAISTQEPQAGGQESTNQHADPAKASSWGKFQFPAEYDKEREAEMIAEAAAHDREEYDLYLNSLATQKPDLLTRAKIAEVAGRFHTIKDLSAGAYEPNGWIVNRLIPSDSIVTLQGQAKSGKSTFILHMIKELISGGEFLGERLEPIKVVYVTEQNRKSFLSQLESANIDPAATNLTALTVEGTLGLTGWKHLFQECERQILETGAKLLVIDSWGRFTGITEQEENKTAPVQERITELRKIVTNTGATVLILHHVRKSGGGMIEAGMGSSALAQQVDVLLSLSGEPTQEDVPPKKVSGPECRMIQSKGRFSDVLNGVQVKWEKEKFHYVLVGMAGKDVTVERLFKVLTSDRDEPMDAQALATMYKATYGTAIELRTVRNLLPTLKKHPSVRQLDGTGKKGIPAKLYKAR
jgi:hypothetical protein